MNELFAPSKLTLALRVLASRSDGYHELEALAVAIDEPHDTLSIVNAPSGVSIEVFGDAVAGVPADASNLAVRAAELVLSAAGSDRGVHIGLHKGIPAGAGLGGGSSDAAAVLRGVGRSCGVPGARLLELAAELGSDVAVCVRGGAAWMRGRGELLEPVAVDGIVRLVIVVPPFRLSTPAVYRAWDELGGPRSTRAVPAPPPVAALVSELLNDLEPAAERVEPRLARFREQLEAVAGRPALLAGSGSAYAVWFDDAPEWHAAAERIPGELGLRAFQALSLPAPA